MFRFLSFPRSKRLFPSPLGDEVLKPENLKGITESELREFPSPLGDEVLKPQYLNRARQQLYSFRPLSGMRCLNLSLMVRQKAR